jgi:hypothetical protein
VSLAGAGAVSLACYADVSMLPALFLKLVLVAVASIDIQASVPEDAGPLNP